MFKREMHWLQLKDVDFGLFVLYSVCDFLHQEAHTHTHTHACLFRHRVKDGAGCPKMEGVMIVCFLFILIISVKIAPSC